jgi:hypothetical protein
MAAHAARQSAPCCILRNGTFNKRLGIASYVLYQAVCDKQLAALGIDVNGAHLT